jgi:hypothetical protein
MVKYFLYFLLISLFLNYSCSLKQQNCSQNLNNLNSVFLKEKPKHIKLKGTAYIKSTPVLFLLKEDKIKLFSPFGKKLGEFDKNKLPDSLKILKELPITLEEIILAKIYKNNISNISCEKNGYIVITKNGVKFYIKNSKVVQIVWKSYKVKYSYRFDKISLIKLYEKDKLLLKIYLK